MNVLNISIMPPFDAIRFALVQCEFPLDYQEMDGTLMCFSNIMVGYITHDPNDSRYTITTEGQ